ncbi:MAG: hypothetical protein L6Q76_25745, partial [Polyangiaceae bacterium]|nr:hypothetical protein [Polyangiaceae bacterium]
MTREETEARDRLLFHLENQTGFWFALVAGDDPRPRTRLREAAETFCREHGQPFILHAPHPQHLMGLAAELAKGESPGLHWIRADGPKALVSQWDSAVRELLVAMNERREAYRRRLDGGVVIEGRESLKRYLRDLAPDLFSIRAFIAEPGISPEFTRPSIPEWRVPRFSFISMFAVTADPERELARAARLADMDSVEARRARAEMLLVGTAGLLMARRAQDAERPCHDLASEVERLLREHPQDPRVNRLLVSTRLTQARVAAANGSSEEALRYLDEAEATLVARAAGLSEVERGVAVVEMMGLLSDRGNVLLGLKNPSGAIESFRKQVEIAQALVN